MFTPPITLIKAPQVVLVSSSQHTNKSRAKIRQQDSQVSYRCTAVTPQVGISDRHCRETSICADEKLSCVNTIVTRTCTFLLSAFIAGCTCVHTAWTYLEFVNTLIKMLLFYPLLAIAFSLFFSPAEYTHVFRQLLLLLFVWQQPVSRLLYQAADHGARTSPVGSSHSPGAQTDPPAPGDADTPAAVSSLRGEGGAAGGGDAEQRCLAVRRGRDPDLTHRWPDRDLVTAWRSATWRRTPGVLRGVRHGHRRLSTK